MGRKRGIQYRDGGYYIQDDRTGFTVRADKARMQWNNVFVDEKFWEPRQPQDFVKGIIDDQNVPIPRPLPPTTFDGPIYTATSSAVAAGATFIPLQYIAGFTVGDAIGLMTNAGSYFNATVETVVSGGIYVYTPVTIPASSGNLVVDYRIPGNVPHLSDRLTEAGDTRVTEAGETREAEFL